MYFRVSLNLYLNFCWSKARINNRKITVPFLWILVSTILRCFVVPFQKMHLEGFETKKYCLNPQNSHPYAPDQIYLGMDICLPHASYISYLCHVFYLFMAPVRESIYTCSYSVLLGWFSFITCVQKRPEYMLTFNIYLNI